MTRTRNNFAYCVTMLIICSALIIIIAGCASTQIVSQWNDPNYKPVGLTKIIIVGMQKDPLVRRIWEDAFVMEINTLAPSVKAVPSYDIFPGGVPDTTGIQEMAARDKYDGILVISKIMRKVVSYYVPEYPVPEGIGFYRHGWGGYWMLYQDVYYPGYYEYDTHIHVRVELLLPQDDGKLIWAATSETIDPYSRQQLRDSVAKVVISQLKTEQYIR